jgi:DNA-binding beta-propeller fold protein YncE
MKFARLILLLVFCGALNAAQTNIHRYLYVATPGIRDYLEYGGHGLLVFDIDTGHKFLRRIPTAGLADNGKPSNVKGIAASIPLQRVFITTLKKMMAIDLVTEKLLWEKTYEGGCDRLAISPNGLTIYCPSLESDHWNVIDGKTGDVKAKIITKSGAHNTIYGLDGKEVYMAGLKSPFLFIADTSNHQVSRTVGPFGGAIRPFTINGAQSLCFVNVNGLLGFEIGDLHTGKKLQRVEIAGFKLGPTKRHGCPSHGIALTPDEKELWVTDAHNSRLHIFDATVMPPLQKESIELRDQPGWITFTLDGKLAYPSTGDVIDVRSRKIITTLQDETGAAVQSEKLVEIDFESKNPVKAGDQFGFGRINLETVANAK